VVGIEAAYGRAGDLDDLQRPHHPRLLVAGIAAAACGSTAASRACIAAPPSSASSPLEARPHRGVRPGEVQVVQGRPQVEPGPADQHRHRSPAVTSAIVSRASRW
jgi:hypothetical protein